MSSPGGAQRPPAAAAARPPAAPARWRKQRANGLSSPPMAQRRKSGGGVRRKGKRKVASYQHRGKQRANNPPVGLVTPQNDPDAVGKKTYAYDPHLDPALHWAGKAEHTSFQVPTVSLHVHERMEPRLILEAVRKHNGNGAQPPLFAAPEENPPLREAVEFYRHRRNWSNRLIAGDSLLVMNSLLEKEGLEGKVQCVYIDPPYGIKYGSNFQPFVNKRDVKDGKDGDLTAEPETIRAFRDTWELGIHSYLSYMRDRLLLARELLTDSGSCFVQISDENVHLVRCLMDEVFGVKNFMSQINYRSMSPLGQKGLANIYDYVIWYAKRKPNVKFRPLFVERDLKEEPEFSYLDTGHGKFQKLSKDQVAELSSHERKNIFKRSVLTSSGYTPSCTYDFEFQEKMYKPLSGKSWRTHSDGMAQLIKNHRIFVLGANPYYRQYYSDFPFMQLENSWNDTAAGFGEPKIYVVQTNVKIIQRCLLMTTDPGDLVFDPTCGSGATAFVAEQWGRRWITCDTSRVAITLAKQRLVTAVFDYYQLAYPDQGVSSGFQYKTIPHITLKSIANDEPPATETLYDQPLKVTKKARVTGPFTVEAVPAPMVKSIASLSANAPAPPPQPADASIARSGETLRQSDWRGELLKTGIRGKRGQRISFSRVEPLPARWLHANAETAPDARGGDRVREPATAWKPQRAVISFGPEHAPLEQRQVENALQEADHLRPKPQIIIFAAFQFDPEAAKDIEATTWHGMTMLKAHMNADMQTTDLKKQRASNESFWLIGQPDVDLRPLPASPRGADSADSADGADGTHAAPAAQWQVEIKGFDYFNTKTGQLESGDASQIALWMLDPDYDGRHLTPQQVFFPLSGPKDGWSRLARTLRAEIDESLIQSYHSSTSLPFTPGPNRRVAIKITDDRGVETLRVLDIPE